MRPDTHLPAKASPQFAARVAAERYGLEATASILPGEYDDNFRLTLASGESFVLKIMHPSREQTLLDLQVHALQHLGARAPSLQLPRIHLSRAGKTVETLRDENGATRYVWMLTYIAGRPLAETTPRAPVLDRKSVV